MIVKLLTEHHLEILSLKGGCRGFPSLHLSKCQIVGNHMSRLKTNNNMISRSSTGGLWMFVDTFRLLEYLNFVQQ